MNSLKSLLCKFSRSDALAAFLLLAVFLLTHGYTYGWDDQHLEIPLLKNLIDPTLYAGDYYVQSLRQNFTSFLYPLLARVIRVDQIPAVYLGLFLVSRYVFFFWVYKLWRLLAGSRSTAFLCVLALLSVFRVEEFLYRTFSHQEFALALVFAGVYYFYRERYVLAAVILGAAANFHSLYSLFPFLYMLAYLLRYFPRHGGRMVFKVSAAFVVMLIPLLIWSERKYGGAAVPAVGADDLGWIEMYMLACPQNFIFQNTSLGDMAHHLSTFLFASREYLALLSLHVLNGFHNRSFQRDRKTRTVIATGWLFLAVSFFFSYIVPVRFVLDLNLVRHGQYMLFFLGGYTIILLVRGARSLRPWAGLLLCGMIPLLRLGDQARAATVVMMIAVLTLERLSAGQPRRWIWCRRGIAAVILAGGVWGLLRIFAAQVFSPGVWVTLWVSWGAVLTAVVFLLMSKGPGIRGGLRQAMVWVPVVILLTHLVVYHYQRRKIERAGAGFWQLQRNWEDMQHYVQAHTPTDSLLLVPYDMTMGGFRILSERKIICSYRDCGIVGFDYQAALEWRRRVRDIEPFKVFSSEPIESAIKNAILKYQVDYIVFMNYRRPEPNPFLTFVYGNEVFSLYKVR